MTAPAEINWDDLPKKVQATFTKMSRATLVAAKTQGCTCDPDISIHLIEDEWEWHMVCAHDDDCPMADAPSGAMVVDLNQ